MINGIILVIPAFPVISQDLVITLLIPMGVWQGVAMDSLKFHLGRPCLTLLCPTGRLPLKRLYGKAGGLQPSSTPLDTPGHVPMLIPTTVRYLFHISFHPTLVSFPSHISFRPYLPGPYLPSLKTRVIPVPNMM
jgi:hypothetical protein